jgi:thiol:disulfide interchange protein
MHQRFFATAVALALASLAQSTTAAVPAPHISITSFDQLAQPLPFPYDERATDKVRVAAALARAKAAHSFLIIDLGGNWCGDCRVLAAVMALPEMRGFMSSNYELVTVDVARMTKNLDIPERYGTGHLEGVPALLIIDPRTNTLVNKGHIFALADARHMTPQALADWLAHWR